jgi:hypothetical protein
MTRENDLENPDWEGEPDLVDTLSDAFAPPVTCEVCGEPFPDGSSDEAMNWTFSDDGYPRLCGDHADSA